MAHAKVLWYRQPASSTSVGSKKSHAELTVSVVGIHITQ